ncbi:MAG TPA: VTT domain-containing protein [Longimicrobium sp.]
MRRYWLLVGGFLAFFLAVFAAAVALGLPVEDARPWMGRGGAGAAAAGVALLVADVALPVPSSGVMLAHGVLFGVWTGAALSLAGSMGAAAVAFALGRAGNEWIRRLVTPAEHERAGRLLARWGVLAIVASRPVPMLAETLMILAGASPMPWGRAMLAAFVGTLPAALAYAAVGATAASLPAGAAVFAAAMLVAGALWWAGRRAGAHPGIPRRTGSAAE